MKQDKPFKFNNLQSFSFKSTLLQPVQLSNFLLALEQNWTYPCRANFFFSHTNKVFTFKLAFGALAQGVLAFAAIIRINVEKEASFA